MAELPSPLEVAAEKTQYERVTINPKLKFMYKYIASATLVAFMATGAAASTMNDFGDGFYFGATPEQEFTSGIFGPSSVFTTVTFTRGGSDFLF